MVGRITADWDTLSVQAMDTTRMYFSAAKQKLEDSELEYTAADVVALASVMARDYHTAALSVAAQKIADSINEFTEVVQYHAD